jgi:hypothetical protein
MTRRKKMKTSFALPAAAVALALVAIPAAADELAGADRLLCAVREMTLCSMDGGCEFGPPSRFNVPDFVEVDLEASVLKTTDASQENRQTPILHLTRQDGFIVLQGFEMGRAFSLNIDEASGVLSAATARPGQFVGGFGVCTPLTEDRD